MRLRWADERATGVLVLVPAFEYRRARFFAAVRIAAGVWLLALTAILYGFDRGGWWGALLVPAAAADFYFAYRLSRVPRESK